MDGGSENTEQMKQQDAGNEAGDGEQHQAAATRHGTANRRRAQKCLASELLMDQFTSRRAVASAPAAIAVTA